MTFLTNFYKECFKENDVNKKELQLKRKFIAIIMSRMMYKKSLYVIVLYYVILSFIVILFLIARVFQLSRKMVNDFNSFTSDPILTKLSPK